MTTKLLRSKDEFTSSITENFGKLPDGEAQAGLQHLLERHPRISMEELYEGKTLISKDWDTNKDCLENRTPNRSMVKFLEGAYKFSINGSKHGLRTWTISGQYVGSQKKIGCYIEEDISH